MPLKSGFRNVPAQIEEMKLKISLLEDDKKAYRENTEQTMKENKERILTLRRENRIKRKEISRNLADGEMIGKSLEKLSGELKFLTNHSATVAVETLDEKTFDLMKTLNILRFDRKNQEKKLLDLQKENEMLNENSFEFIINNTSDNNDNSNNYKFLELENQLDKTRMKCKEAEQIQHTYHLIRSKLEEEQQTLPGLLDEVEADIKRLQIQLKQLKNLEKDAKVTLESTKNEFEKKEKMFLVEKRARDSELARVKKDADEKKSHSLAVQQRIKNRGNSSSGKSPSSDLLTMTEVEQNMEKIKSYEEAFSIIKRATGISDTRELVKRFKTQRYRKDQLNEMKVKNDVTLETLTSEKLEKQHEFQQLQFKKVSIATSDKNDDDVMTFKDSHHDNMFTKNIEIGGGLGGGGLGGGDGRVDDATNNNPIINDEDSIKRDIVMKLERNSNLLTQLKTGVEHLHEKLKPVKMPSVEQDENIVEDADCKQKDIGMEMLQKLNECEIKLKRLFDKEQRVEHSMTSQVDDVIHDEKKLTKSAESAKPQKSMEDIHLETMVEDSHDDGLESNDDDDDGDGNDVMTRNDMKKLSQQIIENKNKRRQVKRKKNINVSINQSSIK